MSPHFSNREERNSDLRHSGRAEYKRAIRAASTIEFAVKLGLQHGVPQRVWSITSTNSVPVAESPREVVAVG